MARKEVVLMVQEAINLFADALFDNPLCIALDSEENFFIGEESSKAIRKMTIE